MQLIILKFFYQLNLGVYVSAPVINALIIYFALSIQIINSWQVPHLSCHNERMNLIDGYGTYKTHDMFQEEQKQIDYNTLPLNAVNSDFPFYLLQLKEKILKKYPKDFISIFTSYIGEDGKELSDGQEILTLLQKTIFRQIYQFYLQMILNPKNQSITIRGTFLTNSIPVKLNSKQRINMSIRLANNINMNISPLKIAIDPKTGNIHIVHCSFIDASFSKLYTPKNIACLSNKMCYIIGLIKKYKHTLIYFFEQDSTILTSPKMQLQSVTMIIEAAQNLTRLQNSLYLMNIDVLKDNEQLCPNRKRSQIIKNMQFIRDDIIQNGKCILSHIEQINLKKKSQLTMAASQNYIHKSMIQYASKFDFLVNFRIYPKIKFDDQYYVEWEHLSQGGFGKIQSAVLNISLEPKQQLNGFQQELQIKVTRKTDLKAIGVPRVARQKKILQKLRNKCHPNVVTFLDVAIKGHDHFLYSVYEQNLSLDNLLRRHKEMSLYQKIVLLQQAAKGLLFLHKNCIVHLDFKPGNVMVGRNYLAKVGDFGQSLIIVKGIVPQHKFGYTFPYAPPQLYMAKKKLSQAVDVFSLGMAMYDCLFGQFYWSNALKKEEFKKKIKENDEFTPHLTPEFYKESVCGRISLILAMLSLRCSSFQSSQRPTMSWVVTTLQCCRASLQIYR